MKNKLDLDTVCLVFAIKRRFGDATTLLQAFRNYWCGYNADYSYMKPEDYRYNDIRSILRHRFAEILNCADYPAGLYSNYTWNLDQYTNFHIRFEHGNYLTEDEKQAGEEIWALLETIWNIQVHKDSVGNIHGCINGFSEALIKEANKILDDQEEKYKEFIAKK